MKLHISDYISQSVRQRHKFFFVVVDANFMFFSCRCDDSKRLRWAQSNTGLDDLATLKIQTGTFFFCSKKRNHYRN